LKSYSYISKNIKYIRTVYNISSIDLIILYKFTLSKSRINFTLGGRIRLKVDLKARKYGRRLNQKTARIYIQPRAKNFKHKDIQYIRNHNN
jgi:hypothetical protein